MRALYEQSRVEDVLYTLYKGDNAKSRVVGVGVVLTTSVLYTVAAAYTKATSVASGVKGVTNFPSVSDVGVPGSSGVISTM